MYKYCIVPTVPYLVYCHRSVRTLGTLLHSHNHWLQIKFEKASWSWSLAHDFLTLALVCLFGCFDRSSFVSLPSSHVLVSSPLSLLTSLLPFSLLFLLLLLKLFSLFLLLLCFFFFFMLDQLLQNVRVSDATGFHVYCWFSICPFGRSRLW